MQYRNIFPPDFFSLKLCPHKTITDQPPWLCSPRGVFHPLNCTVQELEESFAASVAAVLYNHPQASPAASGVAEGQRAVLQRINTHTLTW